MSSTPTAASTPAAPSKRSVPIALAMQEGYSTARPEVRDMGFGAGMGLPNMQKNVDKMNVISEVGVGTTVEMKVNFQ